MPRKPHQPFHLESLESRLLLSAAPLPAGDVASAGASSETAHFEKPLSSMPAAPPPNAEGIIHSMGAALNAESTPTVVVDENFGFIPHPAGEDQVFDLQAAVEGTLIFEGEYEFDGDATMTLLDANNNVLHTENLSFGGAFAFSTLTEKDQIFSLQVTGDSEGAFTLRVYNHDRFEPNGTAGDPAGAATDLSSVVCLTEPDLTIPVNDTDWFTWTAAATGSFNVGLLYDRADGVLTFNLYRDVGGVRVPEPLDPVPDPLDPYPDPNPFNPKFEDTGARSNSSISAVEGERFWVEVYASDVNPPDTVLDRNKYAFFVTSEAPCNEAPVAENDAYSTDEDTPLEVPAPGVLGNDTDANDDELTAILVSGPSHGTLELAEDGSFSYTPDENYFGDDSFTYKANDGLADSNEATVALTINPIDDAPVAVDDEYSTDEDTALIVDTPGVLGNDTDVDEDTLHAKLVAGPEHGTLDLRTDGSFTYTPNANFNGTDSFTYQACAQGTKSNIATVTITVDPVNDAPVATDDSYSLTANTPLAVPAPGVLGNDSDVENDPLTAVLVDNPDHGTLDFHSDGSFVYTPNANFTGTDSFTYQANDGNADSNVATVTLTVNQPIFGKVTGNGSIDEKLRTFKFSAESKSKKDGIAFSGNLEFQDKLQGLNLRSTEITLVELAADGIHGTFSGTATVNGASGYTFKVWVEDNGEKHDSGDKFRIQITGPNGFFYDSSLLSTNGGTLDKGGNIQLLLKK